MDAQSRWRRILKIAAATARAIGDDLKHREMVLYADGAVSALSPEEARAIARELLGSEVGHPSAALGALREAIRIHMEREIEQFTDPGRLSDWEVRWFESENRARREAERDPEARTPPPHPLDRSSNPSLGAPAPCERCGAPGEWTLLYPSLEDDSPIAPRCPEHLPEDDFS